MSASIRATGMYLIGIAAELAGMHPQTLRVYERRGLITPTRTAGRTRMYTDADVALLLRRIQELSEAGLNLAGIERVLELEARCERAERRVRALQDELARERMRAGTRFMRCGGPRGPSSCASFAPRRRSHRWSGPVIRGR